MGRGRRLRRHALDRTAHVESAMEIAELAREVLAPTFVSVEPHAWEAESDFPVLALDGLQPSDAIAGPVLALYEPSPEDARLPDSDDPSQLSLEDAAAIEALVAPSVALVLEADPRSAPDELPAAALVLEPEPIAEPEVERPLLVLESEPPVEVQAELELVVEKRPSAETVTIAEEIPAEAPEVVEIAVAPAPEPEPEPVDPVEAAYQEARAAAADGRLHEARTGYLRVIAERPEHLGARNNLALLLEQRGDQQGALAEYDKAVELDGEHVRLLTNRGALLGAMGRYAAAERDLKKVLRTDPSDAEALFQLGVVMTRKGLWAEAVPQLRRVVEVDAGRGMAHFYLGEALNHVDDLAGAMAAYQRAAELMPEYGRSLYGLGIVYDRMGRPDDAARMYRKSREVGRR